MGLLGFLEKAALAEEVIDRVTPKVSLETFLESVSDSLDQEIIRMEAEESLYFLGGKMHFSLDSVERKIILYAEMYYQTEDGEFQKSEQRGEYMLTMLKQDAVDYFVQQIKEQGEVVIEINRP